MAIDRTGKPEFVQPRQVISRRKKKVFLQVLERNGGNVRGAAEAVGYKSATTLYQYRSEDPVFAKDWDNAMVAAGDVIEQEVIRRGIEGIDKPQWYKGEVVGYDKVYSDRLAETLLKGHKEKYRDRINVDANTKVEIGIAVVPAVVASREDWEKAAAEVHQTQDDNRITIEGTVVDVTPKADTSPTEKPTEIGRR
jgi:hypothetical protein